MKQHNILTFMQWAFFKFQILKKIITQILYCFESNSNSVFGFQEARFFLSIARYPQTSVKMRCHQCDGKVPEALDKLISKFSKKEIRYYIDAREDYCSGQKYSRLRYLAVTKIQLYFQNKPSFKTEPVYESRLKVLLLLQVSSRDIEPTFVIFYRN